MNEEISPQQGDLGSTQKTQNEAEGKEGGSIIEKLHALPIILIEKKSELLFEKLQAYAPEKEICFCDGLITDIENGYPTGDEKAEEEKKWERDGTGFRRENVLVIDHHMKLEEMRRNISSTNLAIEYVLKNGPVDEDTVVIITHTDCDSILSAAIMRGILEPKEEFGVAAIAADHTGEANQIGDLVQALEKDKKGHDLRDMEFSYRNLEHLLRGEELEPMAKEILEHRYNQREQVLHIIEEGMKTTASGKVFYTELEASIDSGLFPPMIRSAAVILLYIPLYDKDTKERVPGMEAKVRLGLNVPDGTDLKKIMKKYDLVWGGRWDAGSNQRGKNIEDLLKLSGHDPVETDLEEILEKSAHNPDEADLQKITEIVDPIWGGHWESGPIQEDEDTKIKELLVRGTKFDIETYAQKLDQAYQTYIESLQKSS